MATRGEILTQKFRYFNGTSIAFPDAGQYICWVNICVLHSRMSHHPSRSPGFPSLFSLKIYYTTSPELKPAYDQMWSDPMDEDSSSQ
jgi:hypothetical protein